MSPLFYTASTNAPYALTGKHPSGCRDPHRYTSAQNIFDEALHSIFRAFFDPVGSKVFKLFTKALPAEPIARAGLAGTPVDGA